MITDKYRTPGLLLLYPFQALSDEEEIRFVELVFSEDGNDIKQ
jgi:hypothetical protein